MSQKLAPVWGGGGQTMIPVTGGGGKRDAERGDESHH